MRDPRCSTFFILYTAWMTAQDKEVRHECVMSGNIPPLERAVLSIEHNDDAIAGSRHTAWTNGTSSTLFDVLGYAAPVSLLSVEVSFASNMCAARRMRIPTSSSFFFLI